jgi:hypothetical protein
MSLTVLRQLLQERIGNDRALFAHPQALRDIFAIESHSVTITAMAPQTQDEDFNCYMHALGLSFAPATSLFGRYYVDGHFVQYVHDQGALLARSGTPQAGDLALYCEQGRFTHAGVVISAERIQSKWGCGHLYEHPLLEVPTSYGAEVRFYQPIGSDDAYRHLRNYHGWRQ